MHSRQLSRCNRALLAAASLRDFITRKLFVPKACERARRMANEPSRGSIFSLEVRMLRVSKAGLVLLGFVALFLGGLQPASAGCQLIKACLLYTSPSPRD